MSPFYCSSARAFLLVCLAAINLPSASQQEIQCTSTDDPDFDFEVSRPARIKEDDLDDLEEMKEFKERVHSSDVVCIAVSLSVPGSTPPIRILYYYK